MYCCNNKCERESFKQEHSVKKGIGGSNPKSARTADEKDKRRYKNGFKRCKTCNIFLKWNTMKCPCCSNQLMVSRRSLNNKRVQADYDIKLPYNISIDIKLNKDKWDRLLTIPK